MMANFVWGSQKGHPIQSGGFKQTSVKFHRIWGWLPCFVELLTPYFVNPDAIQAFVAHLWLNMATFMDMSLSYAGW